MFLLRHSSKSNPQFCPIARGLRLRLHAKTRTRWIAVNSTIISSSRDKVCRRCGALSPDIHGTPRLEGPNAEIKSRKRAFRVNIPSRRAGNDRQQVTMREEALDTHAAVGVVVIAFIRVE